MKFADIKKLPKDECDKKIVELRTELMKLNAQIAIGTTPKNTKQVSVIKRTLAKMETLKKQNVEAQVKVLHVKKYKSL